MAIVAGDFVQVLHEGSNDITQYVVSYRRYASLCEIGDTFEMVLSPDLDVTLSPYDDIRITEWYDGDSGVVLRGYVLTIAQDFSGAWVIQGQDRSVLLFDYFIPTQIKSKGESVDFWIQFYADQVGLGITFQASSANVVVAPDTLMGMQSAGEGILTMERLAAYFVRFDSSANELVAYRLGSSQPVITIDDVVEGRRLKGTEKTRNVVRVYGGYRYSLDPDNPPELLTSVARTDIPELLVDKTVVVVSPGLQKQTYLDIVADRILNAVNSIDDVHFYQLPKFVPNIDVGQIAFLNVDHSPHISYAGERKISSIETSFDQSGAITTIGIGEKCPRISIQFPTPPVYATTTEDGVAVSWNAGNSFIPSNTGLTGSGLMGENIGVNSYGQQMVLTAAGIFRRPSTAFSWAFVDDTDSLPDPVNDSNDLPSGTLATALDLIRVVDEPTNRNAFHFLANATTSGLGRTWVYTTKDFGDSWDTTQLYISASGQDHDKAPSGRSYDVYGHDLFGGIDNNVFALITSTADFFQEKFEPEEVYFGAITTSPTNRGYAGTYTGDGNPLPGVTIHEHTAGDVVVQSMVYSLPENRDICYWVVRSVHNPSTERAWYISVLRTDDGAATWDVLIDEVLFYTGDFSGPSGNSITDNGGFIMFDYASTTTDFNMTVTGSTHHQGTGGGTTVFYGFFFNDNYETDTHNSSSISTSTTLGLTSDAGVFSMNHERPSAHSINTDSTNYGYNSVYTTTAHVNMVPDFTDIDVKMAVVQHNMTAQSLSIVQSVDENFLMGPEESWTVDTDGGVYSADGSTPFWFWSYRERIDDATNDYDRHYMYMRGSSITLDQHEGDEIFIPFGTQRSTGTGGIVSIDGFGKTMNSGGSRVSPAAGNLNNTNYVSQGNGSTSTWSLISNFTLREFTTNHGVQDIFWTDTYTGLQAVNFAWKDFTD